MNQIQKPSIQLDCEQIKAVLEYQRSVRLHNDNERLKAAFKRGELEANPGETLYLPGAIEVAVVRPVCKKIYICKEKRTGDEILCARRILHRNERNSFTGEQYAKYDKGEAIGNVSGLALIGIVCLAFGCVGISTGTFDGVASGICWLLLAAVCFRGVIEVFRSASSHSNHNDDLIETLGLSRYLDADAQQELGVIPPPIMKKNYLADAKVGE